MKILFFMPNYLPHIGGVEKHVANLSKQLSRDNQELSIVVLKAEKHYSSYEVEKNLTIYRIDCSQKRLGNRINMLRFLFKKIKMILQQDIIHFHDYGTFYAYGLPLYPLFKLFGKKLYMTFHGWEGDVPPKRSVVFKRKIAEKLVDGNICVGHFIEKWYGTKADIISYGGVDRVDKLDSLKEKYILFIGRLENDTGISDYIKAWEIINTTNMNLKFIICGDGTLREVLEAYIFENNITNVLFKGFVQNVEEYIRDANVIFTSGYLGILEAFSYKKKVIATYDNALKEDYLKLFPNAEKMMWITDNCPKNIVSTLNDALLDRDKCEVAYLFAQKSSWKRVKEEYYKLWKIENSLV